MITPTRLNREEAYRAVTTDGVLNNEAVIVEVVATLFARIDRLIELCLDINSDTPS
jgi:hypothetical protein